MGLSQDKGLWQVLSLVSMTFPDPDPGTVMHHAEVGVATSVPSRAIMAIQLYSHHFFDALTTFNYAGHNHLATS